MTGVIVYLLGWCAGFYTGYHVAKTKFNKPILVPVRTSTTDLYPPKV